MTTAELENIRANLPGQSGKDPALYSIFRKSGLTVKVVKIEAKSRPIYDTFILGHPLNGVLGRGKCVGSWSFDKSLGTTVTDDFSDGDYTNNPTWTVVDGSFRATNYALETTNSVASSTAVTSFNVIDQMEISIQADLYLSDLNPIAMIGVDTSSAVGPQDGYFVILHPTYARLARYDSHSETVLVNNATTYNKKTKYTLYAERDSSGTWTFKVNDTTIGTATDTTYKDFNYIKAYLAHYDYSGYGTRADNIVVTAGTTTINDATGLGDASSEGLTSSTDSVLGDYSVNFDGSSYATVSRHSYLEPSDISISVWLKQSSLSAGTVVSKADTSNNKGYILETLSTGAIKLRLFDGTTEHSFTSTNTMNANEWNHIVATFDGSTAKISVNNSVETFSDTFEISHDTSADLTIGAYYNGTSYSNYYTGLMDELKIYETALSNSEITNLYYLRPASATAGIARLGDRRGIWDTLFTKTTYL